MTSIRCRGILFDLDGVLVDSTPAVARVWAGWAREHGFDADQVVKEAHGRPSISTIRELLPHADHAAEDREVERREIADIDGVIPLPGAMELLQALPLQRWAIVTSCTRPLAGVRIGAAGLPKPRNLVTSTDVKHGKPDPEPYLKAHNSSVYPQATALSSRMLPPEFEPARQQERALSPCAPPRPTPNFRKLAPTGLSMTVLRFFWIPRQRTKTSCFSAAEQSSACPA